MSVVFFVMKKHPNGKFLVPRVAEGCMRTKIDPKWDASQKYVHKKNIKIHQQKTAKSSNKKLWEPRCYDVDTPLNLNDGSEILRRSFPFLGGLVGFLGESYLFNPPIWFANRIEIYQPFGGDLLEIFGRHMDTQSCSKLPHASFTKSGYPGDSGVPRCSKAQIICVKQKTWPETYWFQTWYYYPMHQFLVCCQLWFIYINRVQGVCYVAFAKAGWTTKTCWNHKPNPGPWTHYTERCTGKLNQPNHGIFHVISTTYLITWSNWTSKISKIPLFVRPKLRRCTWHPTLSLPASKREEESQEGATRGLNKHLSTLHSRSIALNLSLPSIKQKTDQNNKSNVLLVAYTSVTQWIFGHFLRVSVKYPSIYNDRCWAHLGIIVSFMFGSSSPLSPVSWHLNCGSNSSARPEWTSTVDLCDQKGEANFPKSIHGTGIYIPSLTVKSTKCRFYHIEHLGFSNRLHAIKLTAIAPEKSQLVQPKTSLP